jgi:hypothetical protein
MAKYILILELNDDTAIMPTEDEVNAKIAELTMGTK